MDKFQAMLLRDLTKSKSIANYDDSLIVADIHLTEKNKHIYELTYGEPLRFETLSMLLIEKGGLDVDIDFVPYKIEPNDLILIMPSHIFKVNQIGSDMRAKLINVSLSFLNEFSSFPGTINKSISNYMEIRKKPVTPLNDTEYDMFYKNIESLKDRINDLNHSYRKEKIQNSFVNFFLDTSDCFLKKKQNFIKPTLSRKEEIMENFLELLVKHCRTEHGVYFYAKELFITPQYLSLILKELTGRSANKWIDEATMREAKQLLRTPNMSVQQVASELRFSDQSTFGKFFKKQSGISPSEYKKNN